MTHQLIGTGLIFLGGWEGGALQRTGLLRGEEEVAAEVARLQATSDRLCPVDYDPPFDEPEQHPELYHESFGDCSYTGWLLM